MRIHVITNGKMLCPFILKRSVLSLKKLSVLLVLRIRKGMCMSYQAWREAFIDADATRTPRPCGFDRHSEEWPSFSIEIVDARKNLSCQ